MIKFIVSLLLLAAASGASAQTTPDWRITAEPANKLLANFDTVLKVGVKDGQGKQVTGATEE